jgi:hypothetical protein
VRSGTNDREELGCSGYTGEYWTYFYAQNGERLEISYYFHTIIGLNNASHFLCKAPILDTFFSGVRFIGLVGFFLNPVRFILI